MLGARWILVLATGLLMGSNLSGCGRGIFSNESIVDAKQDEHGHVTLLDSPRNWRDFTETVDLQVAHERAGRSPPGIATWNEHWLLRIRSQQSNRENSAKYIAYIIEARQREGLPDLEGYPPRP